MRGLIDNSVNLGGDQTITGQKKFMQTNIDVDVLPDDTMRGAGLTFIDKNGVQIGKIEPRQRADGYVEMATSALNNNKYANIVNRVKEDGTSEIYTSAKSNGNNTVVTTVAHNAAQNGYFKLGNGLIIQWGYTTGTTITLPLPFTSATSYGVSLTAVRTSAGNSWYGCVNTITSTSFKYLQDSSKSPAYWVAIGY